MEVIKIPQEFEGWVNEITKYYTKKGFSPKRAKSMGYAIATKRWHNKYPGKPLH